ncbi:MAG: hypothetical protein PGN09_14060 [Sphingomonas fennica]
MIAAYLRDVRHVLVIGGGFASLPLLLSLAALQPPWPPAIGYVSAAVVPVASLLVWEWVRDARRTVRRRWMLAALMLTLGGLAAYMTGYSLFVEDVPGSAGRVVRGYRCTADAALVYGAACPDLPRDALREAEWEAPLLWTRGSITIVRLGLAAAWLAFVAGLVAFVGAVVAGRRVGMASAD